MLLSRAARVVRVICSSGRASWRQMATGVLGPALRQQDALGLVQLPVSILGAGVVEGHHKIPQGCGVEALLDGGPGGEAVAEADGAEIMGEWCAQAGRGHLQGGNARVYCKAGALLLRQAQPTGQGRPSHAVNAAIAGRDQGHSLPLAGQGQGSCAALLLLPQHPVKPQLVGGAQGSKRFR